MLNSGYPQAYSNGLTPVFIIQWELVTHHLSLTCWSHIWTDWLSIHAQLITPKQSWHIFGFFLYFLIQTIPPSPSKQSRVQPIIRSAENKQLLFFIFKLFSVWKTKEPTLTHLVVWSPSATARWTSQTNLLRQAQGSTSARAAPAVGSVCVTRVSFGCHALGQRSEAGLRAARANELAML